MRVKYKQWAVDYIDEHKENQFDLFNEDKERLSSFINEKKTFIEIGPGKGEFILNMARKFQEFNFIVIELNKTISGICLRAIDESGLTNVRLVSGDFYKFVNQIDEECIEGVFLNFSDPWPRKKHAKRRLTHTNFLKNYAYILKPGHYLYFKTDNLDLFNYSLEEFNENKWEILSITNDYNLIDDFDAETEFEKKYKEQGIKINRLIARKSKETLIKEGDNIIYENLK